MGDAGEGLIDADRGFRSGWKSSSASARRMRHQDVRDPEQVHALESLRLARTELERQLGATTHERRRAQIAQAIEEVDRRDDGGAAPDSVRDPSVSRRHQTPFPSFARSLGYLDWASQPNPFRSFREAPEVALHPRPDASAETTAIGDLLRYALGLSAWKQDPLVALVAARQSVERQSPSDRSLRRRRSAVGPDRLAPACITTRRIGTRSSSGARSTRARGRRCGALGVDDGSSR